MAEKIKFITATGRKKSSVARVRLKPGQGTFVINGRKFEEYFASVLKLIINQPLEHIGMLAIRN
jgi:small subunit ribosomal protein S9